MFHLIRYFLWVLIISVSISACGGGDGGSGGEGIQTSGTINSRNAQDVVTRALSGNPVVITGSQVNSSQVTGRDVGFSVFRLVDLGSTVLRMGVVADTRAVVPVNENCAFGGTLSGQFDTGTDNLPGSGDTLSLTLSNCAFVANQFFNGIFNYTFNRLDATAIEFTAMFDNVTLTTSGVTYSYGNDVLTYSIAQSGNVTTANITSPSLTVMTNGETWSYSDINYQLNVDSTTQVTNFSSDYTMNISSIEKPLTVKIDPPFVFNFNTSTFPTEGKMTISARDGSFVELDADGGDVNTAMITFSPDGNTTESQIVNWTELQ